MAGFTLFRGPSLGFAMDKPGLQNRGLGVRCPPLRPIDPALRNCSVSVLFLCIPPPVLRPWTGIGAPWYQRRAYSAPSLALALIFLTRGGFHSPVSASRFGA